MDPKVKVGIAHKRPPIFTKTFLLVSYFAEQNTDYLLSLIAFFIIHNR